MKRIALSILIAAFLASCTYPLQTRGSARDRAIAGDIETRITCPETWRRGQYDVHDCHDRARVICGRSYATIGLAHPMRGPRSQYGHTASIPYGPENMLFVRCGV